MSENTCIQQHALADKFNVGQFLGVEYTCVEQRWVAKPGLQQGREFGTGNWCLVPGQ